MDVFEAIHRRRSIRKYQDIPVEWDKVGHILDAARVAPTAGNLQSWKFIVVRDGGKRKELAEACLQQYWMEQAEVHVVIVTELQRYRDHYGKKGDHYAAQGAAIAAQNMMLAAHALGLGTCFVSAFDEEMIDRIFGLPADAHVQGVLTIGYADEQPDEPLRYTLENVVRIENYGGLGRVGDMDGVIWNFALIDKSKEFAQEAYRDTERATRKKRAKLFEDLRKKTSDVKKQLEERGKKKRKK